MGQSLEEAILKLYAAHDDPTQQFANPHIIDGLGCSDRFGWPPNGWSHYSMFHLLEPILDTIPGEMLEIG
ncbi:MAG: hypothetical protein KKD77_22205, partial [Gammaproteobacteria bacterium]|nr:hypothetical protein [Gammaproteobacteria bacterium]